jgi:excisionase family DNA binding protein
MRDAAQNPSGGAGLTAGIGAGMGIGGALQDALKQGREGGQTEAAAPGEGGPPSIMTPSEAASYLKVAEEDVIAAIEEGQLKAKKIGKAYRISREAIDEFLSG